MAMGTKIQVKIKGKLRILEYSPSAYPLSGIIRK